MAVSRNGGGADILADLGKGVLPAGCQIDNGLQGGIDELSCPDQL